LVTTWVLPEDQFLSALIAAHICCSILRMESSGLLDFHRIHEIGPLSPHHVPLSHLVGILGRVGHFEKRPC
jgi:hypothetical protein